MAMNEELKRKMNDKKGVAMPNIMLDIETLGTVITQIGAVYFDWTGTTGETFLINIDINSCLEKGLEIRSQELQFWLRNKSKISWDKDTIVLTDAIEELTAFCNLNKNSAIWSHYYDLEIIDIACHSLGRKLPFHYSRWKDIRTLLFLSGFQRESGDADPKTHNALDDCFYQVDYCCLAYSQLVQPVNPKRKAGRPQERKRGRYLVFWLPEGFTNCIVVDADSEDEARAQALQELGLTADAKSLLHAVNFNEFKPGWRLWR